MATQIATAGPTLSLHTEHCLSTRPYAPGSKHHTCSSDLANAGLLRGTSSLNACSSSGSFYDLPIPSHGKKSLHSQGACNPQMSIPACLVWSPTHVRMTYLSPELCCPEKHVGDELQVLAGLGSAVPPQLRQLFDGRQYVFSLTQWIGGAPAHFTRLSCLTHVMTGKHNSERTCYSFWSLKSTAVSDLE